jgi:hypothetical protein
LKPAVAISGRVEFLDGTTGAVGLTYSFSTESDKGPTTHTAYVLTQADGTFRISPLQRAIHTISPAHIGVRLGADKSPRDDPWAVQVDARAGSVSDVVVRMPKPGETKH